MLTLGIAKGVAGPLRIIPPGTWTKHPQAWLKYFGVYLRLLGHSLEEGLIKIP